MTPDDRQAFSLKIIAADDTVKALDMAKAQLQVEVDKLQKLDIANKNLFDPVNVLTNAYQSERAIFSGVVRTTFTEDDIQGAAAKKPRNAFFPNDLSATVPSLSSTNNVWTQVAPFALNTAIGKTYGEAYAGTTQKEQDLIDAINTLISSASTFTEIEKTSGQHVSQTAGSCSIPTYTTQSTCIAATPVPGVWTPGVDVLSSYPAVITLASDLTTAVNALKTFLLAEIALIATDPNATNQAQNNAAKDNINNVIVPALNTWLAYLDIKNVPGSVTAAQFPTYDPSLLAPTKLHSTQLTALSSALSARTTFAITRLGQIDTIIGSIAQNIADGTVTGTGLYFKRYNLLGLRLNALGGSLIQLSGMKSATGAQDAIKNSTKANKATYLALLPTSALSANANGTAMISVLDASLFAVGDTVYVAADKQDEIVRAIKAINGNRITLNDVVPAKYAQSAKGRIYKEA